MVLSYGLVLAVVLRWLASVIVVEFNVLILRNSVPAHDRPVGRLVAVLAIFVTWVEFFNAFLNVEVNSVLTLLGRLSAMVSVPGGIEGLSLGIISEEHVLCVVVDQIALLFTEILLGDKPSDSQLVDDLQDVEL